MKKTYSKNIFREVKGSFSRFLAILAIVALGTGFLAGLMATAPDMKISVDSYYRELNMMDLRIVSTMGLTQGDVSAVSNVAGVEATMPSYTLDALVSNNSNETMAARIHSLPDDTSEDNEGYQNRVVLKSGRMPENAGECVLREQSVQSFEINIGDTLTLSDQNDNLDSFNTKTFTVVGTVDSSYYMSAETETTDIGNGSIGIIIFTTEDAFNLSCYTEIYVTASGTQDIYAFTEGYDDLIDRLKDNIENIKGSREKTRYTEILDEANAKLSDAKEKYNEAKEKSDTELNSAKKKLDAAEAEIETQENTLDENEASLLSVKEELNNNISDFNEKTASLKNLAELKQQLDLLKPDAESLIALQESGTALTEEQQAIVDNYQQLKATYDAAVSSLTSEEIALISDETALNQMIDTTNAQFDASEKQIEEGLSQIETGREELNDAKDELNESKAQYNNAELEAKRELDTALNEINQAQEDIDNIEMPEWYILDRNSNVSYVSFSGNTEKIAAIATVFPIMFFLVAALVSLTTMTRMVDEQRMQIGTLKALGLSNGSVILKYVLYAGVASIVGSVIGLALGFWILPSVIWTTYDMMYVLPELKVEFHLQYALIASIAAIACTTGATVLACLSNLSECPSMLMLPRAPKAGKRVFLEYIKPLWRAFNFKQKITARNILRYKRRFFMTIIGVAGCCALLLTGFGLKDSIKDIVTNQFNDIFKYNLVIGLDDGTETPNELKTILEDEDITSDYLYFSQQSANADNNGVEKELYLIVPSDDSKLEDFITFKHRTDNGEVSFGDDDTVIVTEKFAEQLGLSAGDTFEITNSDDESATFTVGGITENYVRNYVYMTQDCYENAYNTSLNYSMIMAKSTADTDEARDKESTQLLKIDDVSSVQFTADISKSFKDILESIDYVVLVLIISAGMLAFIVLYNLININISERQTEIATIKVLGFTDGEVASYIYTEAAILTIIGIILGLFLGIALHTFVVRTAEVDIIMFSREIKALSFVWSAVLTAVFSVLVGVIVYHKLKKINMVESLKAPE
ncbi:MAG: FtsX-like permease family protein [Eubacteriales bacterium]